MAQSIIYKGQKYVRVDAINPTNISGFRSKYGEASNGFYKYDIAGQLDGKRFSFKLHSKGNGFINPKEVYDERGVTAQQAQEIASLFTKGLLNG